MGKFINSDGICFYDGFEKMDQPGHQLSLMDFKGQPLSLEAAAFIKNNLCFLNLSYLNDMFQRAIVKQCKDVLLVEGHLFEELKNTFVSRHENNLKFNVIISEGLKKNMEHEGYKVLD